MAKIEFGMNGGATALPEATFGLNGGAGLIASKPIAETPLAPLVAKDVNNNNRYDIRDGRKWPTHSEAAGAVVKTVAADPAIKAVVMAEVHGGQADERFRKTVEAANRSGRKPVAVVEGFSTPGVDRMIRALQSGKMTEAAFLDAASKELFAAFTKAQRASPDGLAGSPLTLPRIRNALTRDVLAYHRMSPPVPVFLADSGKFDPRANRDAVMAAAHAEARRLYPERVTYSQVGLVHGQERPAFALKPEAASGQVGVNGALGGKIDGQKPYAARLADQLGGEGVLSILFDDVLWTDEHGEEMRDKKGQIVHWSNLSLELGEVATKEDWPIPMAGPKGPWDAIVPTRGDNEAHP